MKLKKQLDWKQSEIVDIYDEIPLWSAPYGLVLLDNIPMGQGWNVLDIGFGTGFPLIELVQRFDKDSKIIGVDVWKEAIDRAEKKIRILEFENVEIIKTNAENLDLTATSLDLVTSNLGVNNFNNRSTVYSKIYKALKDGGNFCMTSNGSETFKELFEVFKYAFVHLKIDDSPLKEYIRNRTDSSNLIKEVQEYGFVLEKELHSTRSMRFTSALSIFNHSIIRIAFIGGWKELVNDKWGEFLQIVEIQIEKIIERDGCFRFTVPVSYYHFVK
ncbi:MAG: hypothetical protein Kapaf2KO_19630 [Candidatus Kapaibacteriales bacterium]